VFYIRSKLATAYGQGVIDGLRSALRVVSATDPLVMAAALFKSRHPISYADAFAAATALAHDAPLVTGDPELRAVAREEKKLRLEWIGG
jgi:predicted nucleic acid-binding protein